MSKEIRILFLEDVTTDVVMINRALRKAGMEFQSKRVDTKEAFISELGKFQPDVILSDHGLPSFDGFTALALTRELCMDIPFIFVTGSLGEEMTIAAFEGGATDYVLKSNLSNLAPVIRRALREASERAHLKRHEQALHDSEEQFRMLVEGVKDYAMFMLDQEGCVASWNAGAIRLHGYQTGEVRGRHISLFYTDEDVQRNKPDEHLQTAASEGRFEEEGLRLRKSGSAFWASVIITAHYDQRGRLRGFAHLTRNITEHIQAQVRLQKSEERYRRLVEICPDALLVVDAEDRIAFCNPAAVKVLGARSPDQVKNQPVQSFLCPGHGGRIRERLNENRSEDMETPFVEEELRCLDGTRRIVELAAMPLTFQERPAIQVIAHDITSRKSAEETLRRSEALKAAILETAIDAIISVDHEGRVQEWNPAAQKMFGYSRAEVLRRPLDELIVPHALLAVYREGVANYLMNGAASLLGRALELTLRRADGTEFSAELAASRHPTEDPPRCTALIRDITGKKEAEAALKQSEERFRLLVEGVKDYAIYMLDPDGFVTTWNEGAERLYHYSEEEVAGKSFSVFFTPENVQEGYHQKVLERAMAEGRFHGEDWRVRKDGSRFLSECLVTALSDEAGNHRGFSVVACDTTDRREAADECRLLNEQLEHRVQVRTAQLESANRELEAFSYSVSHDLRAPLRHIAGYVEILESEAPSLDESSRGHLRTIADSANQMSVLIDALLEFSRMGRAEIRRQRVRLSDLVEEARRDLHREWENRDIDWRIGDLPEAPADPLMLRQVFVNLISNALKYTRPRGQPQIEIGANETDRDLVIFIRDNGVGFDMEYGGKLFGVFQRLHPAREFEGTGIGLANVRRIINRHGGCTWAEGEVNRGATFYFSLPKSVNDSHE